MPRRYYSSVAQRTALTSSINAATTSIDVNAVTGFPSSFPYTLIIDQDTVSEEAVTVTARSGLNLTVTRGVDGTTATSHSAGATVNHGVTARDFDEPNVFVNLADAKGDIVAASAADTWARVAVGANDTVLTADSAQTAGVKWAAVVSPTVVDAKGDLLVGSASDTVTRLGVGSDTFVLTADSAQATGLKWAKATAGATGGGNDQVFYENDITVTASYTISTNKNAMSAGPITVNSGVTVTVPSGSVWVVL